MSEPMSEERLAYIRANIGTVGIDLNRELVQEIDRLRAQARKDELAMMNSVTLHDDAKCCSALSLIQARLAARRP